MLTDDTRIQVIVPDQPMRWVTLRELRAWLHMSNVPENVPIKPPVKARAKPRRKAAQRETK